MQKKRAENRIQRTKRFLMAGLLFLLLSGLPVGLSVKAEEKEDYLNVYYFYNNPCETCHEVENFAAAVRETFGSEGAPFHYNIIGYYVYKAEGASKVEEAKAHFGISDQEISYPLVVAGDAYLMGEEKVAGGIRELMEKAWEAEKAEQISKKEPFLEKAILLLQRPGIEGLLVLIAAVFLVWMIFRNSYKKHRKNTSHAGSGAGSL